MTSEPPILLTFTRSIFVYINAREAALWSYLQAAELSLVACSSVLDACGHARRWQLALQLLPLARSRRLRPDAVCYNALLAALGRAERRQECQEIFTAALVKAKPVQRVIAYNTTMSVFGSQVLWREALSMLDSMPRQSLRPTVASRLAVLAALRRRLRWPQALQLFKESEAKDAESFNATLAVCEAAAQWQVALQLASGWP